MQELGEVTSSSGMAIALQVELTCSLERKHARMLSGKQYAARWRKQRCCSAELTILAAS